MADSRFFKKEGPFSLEALAKDTGAHLVQDDDQEIMIEDVAPLNTANQSQVTFLDNVRYKDAFAKTQAAACFVSPDVKKISPPGLRLLITKNPYKAYALCAQKFYPGEVNFEPLISERAVIAPSAHIGKGCRIDAGAVIEENVVIGDHCWIGANAIVSHAVIGNHVRLYPGVAIGQDGFGFAIDPEGYVKLPQLGRVIIEDRVEIGANTTVDRGAGPDTVIGQGTWIDNLVQIGHNVRIGKNCVIVAQVGISGSTVIEDQVMIGGQAGIAGHLKVGQGARIGAQTGVMKPVPAGVEVMGSPAVPFKDFMRQTVALNRMGKKAKKET